MPYLFFGTLGYLAYHDYNVLIGLYFIVTIITLYITHQGTLSEEERQRYADLVNISLDQLAHHKGK